MSDYSFSQALNTLYVSPSILLHGRRLTCLCKGWLGISAPQSATFQVTVASFWSGTAVKKCTFLWKGGIHLQNLILKNRNSSWLPIVYILHSVQTYKTFSWHTSHLFKASQVISFVSHILIMSCPLTRFCDAMHVLSLRDRLWRADGF